MLPISEASERNKEPILSVLRECFAALLNVLEIGSGTGQHAVYFARHLAHLTWHPTEQLTYVHDLAARVQQEGGPNLKPPTVLDVRQSIWPCHRSTGCSRPTPCTSCPGRKSSAMYRGIGAGPGGAGLLCVYGPFRYDGEYTSDSNRAFDQMLKERDPLSGLRDVRRSKSSRPPMGSS